MISTQEFYTRALGLPPTPDQQKVIDWKSGNGWALLVRSANGVGKTALLSALAHEDLRHEVPTMILALSKNMTHLQRNFWASFKRQNRNLGSPHNPKKITKTGLVVDDDRQIVLLSPEKNAIESAQGFHAKRVRIYCDEASSLDAEVVEALLSNMSGTDSKIIFMFNPIDPDAYTYELETKHGFEVIEMSALHHPNVVAGREIYPGAITREKVELDLKTYSKPCTRQYPKAIFIPWLECCYEGTAEILRRVCGEWHLVSYDGCIDARIVEAAYYQDDPNPSDIAYVGVDVSRGLRDKTIAAVIDKKRRIRLEAIEHKGVADLIDVIHVRYGGFPIATDDTGVGAALYDGLTHRGVKNVHPINFSQEPFGFYEGIQRPRDARTEMVLLIKQALETKTIKIPKDPALTRELTTVGLEPVLMGKFVRATNKAKIRKKLKRSTDKMDACGLAIVCRELERVRTKKLFLTLNGSNSDKLAATGS